MSKLKSFEGFYVEIDQNYGIYVKNSHNLVEMGQILLFEGQNVSKVWFYVKTSQNFGVLSVKFVQILCFYVKIFVF